MNIIQPTRKYGERVYVNLGYITVKSGKVVGARSTLTGHEEGLVEYLIEWFGGKGERRSDQEWFQDRYVHTTAEEAFKP